MKLKTQKPITKGYDILIKDIGSILEQGRKQAFIAINTILVKTYWEIGKRIAQYENENKEFAGYGSKLFELIAKDLLAGYGKGFSRSNVIYMRLFYIKYQKSQTLSDQLNWIHYVELLMIEDNLERSFYERQCIKEKWSVGELKNLYLN